tara:strand:- start:158 stop:1774 length:1617 start_codon:yes stop_codon:yes gene_type:complete
MSNGYVPGVSEAQYGQMLKGDREIAQEEASDYAKKLNKYSARRGLLGKVFGKAADFAGSKLLTTALAPMLGPAAPLIAKMITKGGGELLGSSTLFSGMGPRDPRGSSVGLNPNNIFTKLSDARKGMDASFAGGALGTAGAELKGLLPALYGKDKSQQLAGMKMDVGSFFNRFKSGMRMPGGYAGPVVPEINTGIMDDYFSRNPLTAGLQEGGSVFNVDYDSIADYARNMRENIKEDDSLGFMESPDIANALAGELTLRRDYKTTPEERDAIERTTANRKRKSNLLQMLDMDKEFGSSIDDTESAYLKSLAGSDTMGRLAGKEAGAQEVYGGGLDIGTEDAYQKSLPEARRLGDLNTLEQMKQGIQSAVGSGEELSQYKIDDIEPMAGMKNPFTGEELGEAPLGPSGTFGMGSLGRVPSPYEGIANALEFATRRPDRSLMDKLIGRNKPRETQKGDSDRLRKLMGDENYFMLPDRKYEDEIQQLLQGFQMGGMPGTSNPIPYQDGGYMQRYNLGGSVAQQPMSYQIGGLLKYKRNPMVG